MRRKGFVLVAAGAALFAAAVPAFAGVGDVISSFQWSGAQNIFRDGDYVYCVVGANTLSRYTAGGSLVGTVALPGLTTPGDADHSPLGPGYLAVLEGEDRIYEYRVSDGSFVRSRPARPRTLGYSYFPGGLYYYLRVGMYIYRYTTNGSLVSSIPIPWSSTSTIAATARFNDAGGEYIVAGGIGAGQTYVFTGTGQTVKIFRTPGVLDGCVCGPGSGYTAKTTYWCNIAFGTDRFAYEIDLGNKNVGLAPTSFGKIKGLYR